MLVHGTNVFSTLSTALCQISEYTEMRNTCMRVQCENNYKQNMNNTRKHFGLQHLIMQDRGQDMDLKNDAEICHQRHFRVTLQCRPLWDRA